MVPTHGGFDLGRDHGFRNPPFLPFRALGAPGAWQQETAPLPRSNCHQVPQPTPAFNFRRPPVRRGPADTNRLGPPFQQPPQPWAQGRGAGGDTNAARYSGGGGDLPLRDDGGGKGGEMKGPPSAPLSPRSAAAGAGGSGRSVASSASAAVDAAPLDDRVQEQAGGGRRAASVAADALRAAGATTIAGLAEVSSPRCRGQVHPDYEPDSPPAAVVAAPGDDAAGPRARTVGWGEEVVLKRDVLEAGVGGMLEAQDEEEDEEGWAMSKEWEEHLRKSPSVQRYLQRMQAKPSTWKDWRGGKKGNKKRGGKKNAAGGGGGGGNNNSAGATADNSSEKQPSKGSRKADTTFPSSSSKQPQQERQQQERQQQQQQQKKKNPGEKITDTKRPPSSKRGQNPGAGAPEPPTPRTAAKQALELELAKIEAHALLYAEQQQHRLLEDAVIPSQLTLF